MNDREKNLLEISDLTIKMLDRHISPQDSNCLEQLLQDDPTAQDFYIDLVEICARLRRNSEANSFATGQEKESSLLMSEIVQTDYLREMIQQYDSEIWDVRQPTNTVTGSSCRPIPPARSLLSVFGAIAAMILVAAILNSIQYWVQNSARLAADKSQIVARITGQVNAVWLPGLAPSDGDSLHEGEVMTLLEGLAIIELEKGTKIALNAPVTIRMQDGNSVFLSRGSIAATVPKQAQGFTVKTENASIVDYGTEFGVSVSGNGETEAHVFYGEVSLRVGPDPLVFRNSKNLIAGQAGKVNQQGYLSSTQYNSKKFVRTLPEEIHFGVPGKIIDLADIVGGGNGFGTGSKNAGVNSATGHFSSLMEPHQAVYPADFEYGYFEVDDLEFIDGVFVPTDKKGRLQVSSQGHSIELTRPIEDDEDDMVTAEILNYESGFRNHMKVGFEGIEYGTKQRPAIVMRRNKGITFDLTAIKKRVPGLKIKKFVSIAGLSDMEPDAPVLADFYVVIDGEIRFAKNKIDRSTGAFDIDVEISEKDRFLTLITAFEMLSKCNSSMFAEPKLILGTELD